MRVLSAAAPEYATPRVVARTTGFFFLVGALAAGMVTTAFGSRSAAQILVGLAAAVAVIVGIGVLRWGTLLSRGMIHLFVLGGTLLISFAVVIAPDDAAAVALSSIFALVAIDAFFFFAMREALAQSAVLVAAQAAVLSLRPGIEWGIWVGLSVLWVAVGLLVGSVVKVASGALVDSLTGLANRRGWDDELSTMLSDAPRRGEPLSVALVDVDHFKQVNDVQGHAAGDELLRSLARDWSAALPDGVLLARRGGDEFALLLPGFTGPAALDAVDRMRSAGGYQSVSAGVAEYRAGETGGDLLRRTDVALYSAKASGRGRTVLSGGDHDLVGDLAAALADGEVEVAFLPVLAIPSERPVAVEALARWRHPVRGQIPPETFIPLAEQNGLIVDLGAAVLRGACRGALLLERAWGIELSLGVNVSGHELADPDYLTRLLAILADAGWPAHRLVVEVTESLLDRSSDQSVAMLTELRNHGIVVAIDDFGAGRSAFSTLDTIPADLLKLDPSFVGPITTSPRRTAMLRMLLDLGRDLGLKVVAEGVETREQVELLADLGFSYVQGHLYGLPAAAALVALPAPRLAMPYPGGGRPSGPQQPVSEARAGGADGA